MKYLALIIPLLMLMPTASVLGGDLPKKDPFQSQTTSPRNLSPNLNLSPTTAHLVAAAALAPYLAQQAQGQGQGQGQAQGQGQGQQQGQAQANVQGQAQGMIQGQGQLGNVIYEGAHHRQIPVAGAYAPPSICGPSFGFQAKDVGMSLGTGMTAFCKLAEVHRVALLSGDDVTANLAKERMATMAFVEAGQGVKWINKIPIARTVLRWIW